MEHIKRLLWRQKSVQDEEPSSNTQDTSLYIYKAVPGLQGIRLICLKPGVDANPLRCSIVHANFSDDYEAVSYVWGDPKLVTPIFCSGKSKIMVSHNCGQALRRLRRKTRPRLLWVDSICINQNDTAERTEEVARMDKIFTRAREVAIYIGPGGRDRHTSAGLRLLQRICDPGCTSLTTAQIESIDRLLSLPWFSRTWVIQEAHLATKATIYSDKTTLPWSTLVSAARRLRRGTILEAPSGKCIKWGQFPCVVELAIRDGHARPTILELMDMARYCRASDLRDKLYAFGGLAPEVLKLPVPGGICELPSLRTVVSVTWRPNFLFDDDDPRAWQQHFGFRPSYNLHHNDIFYVFTAGWIQGTWSTEILCTVQSPGTRHPALPTWVSDWTRPNKYAVLGVPDGSHLRFPRGDMMDYKVQWIMARVSFKFLPDARTLSIQGGQIASVRDVGGCLDVDNPNSRRIILHWREMARQCRQTAGHSAADASEQEFWRTLIADRDNHGNYPPQLGLDDIACCRAWLQEAERWSSDEAGTASEMEAAGPGCIRQALRRASHGRRLFVTWDRLVGLAPPEAQPGDAVVIVSGSRVPFILRREGETFHSLVGECFIYDMTRVKWWSRDERRRVFHIR